MIYKAQVSHVGSNFSCIDILTVLYSKTDFSKDELVISKGWVAASIYALGVRFGLMPQEAIDTFCNGDNKYVGLIEPLGVFGAKIAGGSMGLGLPGAVGLALAKKIKGEEGRVYCLMSDGELAIGTTWESILVAGHHKLDNLVVMVDNNGLQAMGKTEEVLKTKGGMSQWELARYGWEKRTGSGHDFWDINSCLGFSHVLEDGYIVKPSRRDPEKPLWIDFITVKGKGVSIFENDNQWHYRAPNKEHYDVAIQELCQK